MSRIFVTALFLGFQIFSGTAVSAEDRDVSGVERECTSDNECIPLPACHPESCINEKFKSKFKKPEICTEIYMLEAAYEREDCICLENRCHNRKKGLPRDPKDRE